MLEDVPHAVHVVLSWRYGEHPAERERPRRGGSDDSSSRYCEFLTGSKAVTPHLSIQGVFLLLLFLNWHEQRGQVTIQAEATGPVLSISIDKLAGRRMRRL